MENKMDNSTKVEMKTLIEQGVTSEYQLCKQLYGGVSDESRELVVSYGVEIGHFRKSKLTQLCEH